MEWYHLFSPIVEKWVAFAVLAIAFALILHRKVNIALISLPAAGGLIMLGLVAPDYAFLQGVEWEVLGIYWGYGMLAIALRESKLPSWIAVFILSRIKTEKYVLLFLCVLAAVLSSFMANPVVVIMLAPLVIEVADRLKASLFLYLVGLAISSNVVTTVSMVADPPSLILAMKTGMRFLDFYWFQGKVGLGTLSVVGIAAALLTLLLQFRAMTRIVNIEKENGKIASFIPLIIFIASIAALSLPYWNPGIVGLLVGFLSLAFGWKYARSMLVEFDWNSIFFLIGIFIVIATVEQVGLLRDFADWMARTGLKSPTVYLAIFVWISVALSSFIDNVPYTVLMIPVCAYTAQNLGMNPFPFYFGMLVGTGIGGNITPVGATANVLACGMLEKRGYKIELGKYMAISIPFSVAAVLAGHILLQLTWLGK